MVWDDTPLYERGTLKGNIQLESDDKPQRPKLAWSDRVKKGNASATSPSAILSWYEQENAKRLKGLPNEIDEAEKKAALMGVKNKYWIKPV